MIKAILRRLLAWTRSEYACFKIFQTNLGASCKAPPPAPPPGYRVSEVTRAEVETSTHREIADQAGFGGHDALGLAILRGQEIVSLVWIWHGARYREERNFWPLGPRDAKVVQFVTIPSERGRGIATLLSHHYSHELKARGFERAYTRIWWTHRASIRIAEKVGRTHIATVLELRLFGARRPLRFVRRYH